MSHQLINNTLELWSKEYKGPKFHAVLCDPPYGLKFMGKDWDVVSAKEWGEALLPHLYPGALCLMFGGTRTWHKLATGMEEAGFEMWDTLMWLYGQGFPKGQDISKLIDKKQDIKREVVGHVDVGPDIRANNYKNSEGRGRMIAEITIPSETNAAWSGHKTCALKPAWEPILAFRVPAKRTYADLALEYGSGCLNINGARIGTQIITAHGGGVNIEGRKYGGGKGIPAIEPGSNAHKGRYPANLLLDEESAALLDEQSGTLVSRKRGSHNNKGKAPEPNCYGTFEESKYDSNTYGDSGGASRFFYCAKAGTAERNAGCSALPLQTSGGMAGTADQSLKTGSGNERNNKARNHHPTVKPLALTQYLATLLLPPASVSPRRLLVPFAGSGSEIIGALKAGWDEVVGIEQDTDQSYCRIAEARIAHHIGEA